MPQEKIIIKFKPEGHEKLIKAINRLSDAQGRLTGAGKTYSKQAGILDTRNKRNTQSVGGLGMAFSVLRSKLLLATFAMGMIIKPLIRFGKEAAKVESMGRAFNTLSGGTGQASIAMGRLQKATNGTMTEMDLLKQANSAMVLGVTKSSEEMAEMFDIAQRLGRALGQDTAMSVESLITGIGRQSRLMLDNIGIIVKSEEAYKAYADELGITADQLTDSQKKQAFFNATMESARTKVKSLGKETLTSEDAFQQFSTAMTEFGTAIGETLLPHLVSLLDFTTKIVVGWNDFFDTINKGMPEFDPFAKFVETAPKTEGEILKLIDSLDQERLALIAVRTEAGQMGETLKNEVEPEIGAILGIVNESGKQFGEWGQIIGEDVTDEFGNLVSMVQGTDIGEILVKPVMDASEESVKFSENLGVVNTDIALLVSKIAHLREELAKLREGTDEATGGFTEFWEKNQAGAELLVSGFSNMTSAIKGELDARIKNEMETLKASSKYQRAVARGDKDALEQMEKDKMATFAKERKRIWFMEKGASFAEAGINVATAYTKALAQGGGLFGIPLATLVAGLGAIQLGFIAAQQPPQFATGGMIGGRRHSQGGTMIEAEQGEFVMSRSAVQSVGIENLNRMNEGGSSSAVTVNVSGNVLSQDFVEGELAENIKEAIRRGTDFGIS